MPSEAVNFNEYTATVKRLKKEDDDGHWNHHQYEFNPMHLLIVLREYTVYFVSTICVGLCFFSMIVVWLMNVENLRTLLLIMYRTKVRITVNTLLWLTCIIVAIILSNLIAIGKKERCAG